MSLYDIKKSISDTLEFFRSQPLVSIPYSKEEVRQTLIYASRQLSYERDNGTGTQQENLDWFRFLLDCANRKKHRAQYVIAVVFLKKWAQGTMNPYGKGYLQGFKVGSDLGNIYARKDAKQKAEKSRIRQVARATNGRRLIGATTRIKVASEAEKLRQKMTKESAAYAIAEIVGKDSGTVKRYLTELFPGDKWKTTNQ